MVPLTTVKLLMLTLVKMPLIPLVLLLPVLLAVLVSLDTLEHHATSGNHPTTSDGVEGKASAGDKIKGNLEKMAGKITGNEAKVIAGENKAAGRT
ncbi:hypothetical protein G6F42_022335 [Rhizopus arrhizus]|nr:hypothetical protein G6F42_022335 [Rhizopus arrhizus]